MAADHPAVSIQYPERRIDEGAVLILRQRREMLFDLGRAPEVVGVYRRDQRRAGVAHAGVPGRRDAAVLLPDERKARLGAGIRLDNPRGVVAGAVVDDDDFQIAMGLRAHRAQRLNHRARGVIGGNDYGYVGVNHAAKLGKALGRAWGANAGVSDLATQPSLHLGILSGFRRITITFAKSVQMSRSALQDSGRRWGGKAEVDRYRALWHLD